MTSDSPYNKTRAPLVGGDALIRLVRRVRGTATQSFNNEAHPELFPQGLSSGDTLSYLPPSLPLNSTSTLTA